jgi:hypothetical protein
MEGIQHRWDCPARKHLTEAAAAEVVGQQFEPAGFVVTHTRCRFCGRAAAVRSRTPERKLDEH